MGPESKYARKYLRMKRLHGTAGASSDSERYDTYTHQGCRTHSLVLVRLMKRVCFGDVGLVSFFSGSCAVLVNGGGGAHRELEAAAALRYNECFIIEIENMYTVSEWSTGVSHLILMS